MQLVLVLVLVLVLLIRIKLVKKQINKKKYHCNGNSNLQNLLYNTQYTLTLLYHFSLLLLVLSRHKPICSSESFFLGFNCNTRFVHFSYILFLLLKTYYNFAILLFSF
ncbi:hypothetical protein J3Q64DRAFT_1715104 [Phycomyces blakesleeanus]|uniref:Uncharacterized protein n=1 Tax=Phycomyces blakesleeanus TaxID=4837 RepID=A0ABR3BFX3_PHYBL